MTEITYNTDTKDITEFKVIKEITEITDMAYIRDITEAPKNSNITRITKFTDNRLYLYFICKRNQIYAIINTLTEILKKIKDTTENLNGLFRNNEKHEYCRCQRY